MSPEVIAALLGVLIERVARAWGRLWCEPSDWELKFQQPSAQEFGDPIDVSPEEATRVHYSVWLDLFNGKEIPVGLRNISIVFSCDGGEVVSKPLSTTGGIQRPYGGPVDFPPMRIINLSPRQWIFVTLHNEVRGPDVRLLARWKKAEFVGQRQRRGWFESKTFRKTIASRPPVGEPWTQERS